MILTNKPAEGKRKEERAPLRMMMFIIGRGVGKSACSMPLSQWSLEDDHRVQHNGNNEGQVDSVQCGLQAAQRSFAAFTWVRRCMDENQVYMEVFLSQRAHDAASRSPRHLRAH